MNKITKIKNNVYDVDGTQYIAHTFSDLLNHFSLVANWGTDEDGEDILIFDSNELFEATTALGPVNVMSRVT